MRNCRHVVFSRKLETYIRDLHPFSRAVYKYLFSNRALTKILGNYSTEETRLRRSGKLGTYLAIASLAGMSIGLGFGFSEPGYYQSLLCLGLYGQTRRTANTRKIELLQILSQE